MYEFSAQWTIVGPDGTTVQFNDGQSGLYLEEVTGFDAPSVRTNIEDLPESDGAMAGDSYYGQRPVTLRGRVVGSSAAQRNTVIVSLQQALHALTSDLTLKSQASGLPAMQVTARTQGLRLSGGYVKDFLVALICADPLIYSQTLHSVSASGTPLTPGGTFPWAFPVDFGGGVGASQSVNAVNAGNVGTPALLRVWGPITSPEVRNATTGLSVYVDGLTLVSGEYIEIDTNARTVKKNDGTSYYANVRFPATSWWKLVAASNTVQLWGSGAGAGTQLDVVYRDSWA